jgi:hypothetical protein
MPAITRVSAGTQTIKIVRVFMALDHFLLSGRASETPDTISELKTDFKHGSLFFSMSKGNHFMT